MSVPRGPRHAAVVAALRRAEDGAVEIDGPAPGTVYLVDGCVAYAETPEAPGVGERLIAAGRLSGDQWSALREIGERGSAVVEILAAYGVDRYEQAALAESVTVDAMLALMTGQPGADAAARTRFVSGRRHWLEPAVRLDEAAVEGVLALGASDPAHAVIRAETIVRLAVPRRRWHLVTPDQWRAVCRVGERSRVRDLAMAAGAGIHETVAQVGELVEAGLCEVDGPAAPVPAAADAGRPAALPDAADPAEPAPQVPGAVAARPSAGAPASVPFAPDAAVERGPGTDAGGPLADLPRRMPGRSLSPAAALLARTGLRDARPAVGPDEQTLRKLLGSLRQLD